MTRVLRRAKESWKKDMFSIVGGEKRRRKLPSTSAGEMAKRVVQSRTKKGTRAKSVINEFQPDVVKPAASRKTVCA